MKDAWSHCNEKIVDEDDNPVTAIGEYELVQSYIVITSTTDYGRNLFGYTKHVVRPRE